MQVNGSEQATILRALSLYKDTINFTLRNRKAKRSNPKINKYIEIYEQDLLNIDSIETYLGGKEWNLTIQ